MIDREKLHRRFFSPQGKISRFFSLSVLGFSSISFVYNYWLINYYICNKVNCSLVTITDIWVKLSFMFLIIGFCNLVTVIFLYKNKETPNLYVTAITLGFLTALVITGFIPFAIGHEAGELT
jgi:hypothetical protein